MSSAETQGPTPYKVSWSPYVRSELRALLERARAAGHGKEYLAASRDLDARLRTYPQFGEPIMDLAHEGATIWVGAIGPLVVRYAIYEDLRLVMVATPVRELPKSAP